MGCRRAALGALRAGDWDLARMARTGDQAVPQPASLWRRRAWELAGPFNERAWALNIGMRSHRSRFCSSNPLGSPAVSRPNTR